MKNKWPLKFLGIVTILVLTLMGLIYDNSNVIAQQNTDKIESLLLDQLTSQGAGDFIVEFSEQADLTSAYSMDWNARGEYVYNTLLETATRSQANARVLLDSSGLKYQIFFAGNELYILGGGLTLANELVNLPEVSFIRAPRTYYIDPIDDKKPMTNITWAGDLLATHAFTTVEESTDALTAWGITDIKADQFWTANGVKGDGIVVANIDTGVQWNHPALDQAFKCASPSNPACWFDPAGICGGSACDNNGHGTHTMGTMVGDDDPSLTYIVGMAPNAKWIACKGCETNSCSEPSLNACADWMLAPNGNPSNRPNIVNNSWGGGGGETWYLTKVNAWRAAGIFPAFSAGNTGENGCNTLGSPGDYQESFGTAAYNSFRTIADFSSRGPSAFGHFPYTKPNISAPGESICSTIPGDGWSCNYSGTSMASPHTAGAVALLWSCNPTLVGQIDATFQLLQNNTDTAPAGNCGAPPDGQGNYTYGYGYLNVLKAGNTTCGEVASGVLEGHVYDTGGTPINNALVSTGAHSASTDPTGFYSMNLPISTYNVTASKVGYATQTVNGVVIQDGLTTVQDYHLLPIGHWTLGPSMCFDLTRFDGEYYPGTGLIYFLGGRSGTITDGTIYSFNPVTGACLNKGVTMPTPISNYTVNLVNNGTSDLLCTFGGRDSAGFPTRNVQCYNPNTNSASVVTTLPAAWTNYNPGAQVVVDNLVYIFGGFNSSEPYVIVRTDVYDPVANSFTQLGDLNMARAYIMATSVDGIIYAFGGDTYNGTSLVAQTIAEKLDPAVGTWNDAGVADLPQVGDEGRAFGFDSGSSYTYANQIVIATLAQWTGASSMVVLYNVSSNTYNVDFPDLIHARRNHAGVFVSLDTLAPTDGLPGMWVFGGYLTSDSPPYSPTEYFSKAVITNIYLTIVSK